MVDDIGEEVEQHILLSLLQFPLFAAGNESGRVGFAHDLIAEALAARYYARRLRSEPLDVGRRVSSVDLQDPIRLRFIAQYLDPGSDGPIVSAMNSANVQEKTFKVLLSLLLIVRPERDLLKRLPLNLEGASLSEVNFSNRNLSGLSFRQADLSHSRFQDCDLRNTQFEGAFMNRTRFVGSTDLAGADFGDLARIQSLYANSRFVESDSDLRAWAMEATGRSRPTGQPCPAAQQLAQLFGKFVSPMGTPRRDELKRDGLLAGKRYSAAPRPEDCLSAAGRHGYLVGPDHRGRFRRAAGDKYGEIVRLVRDSRVSQGLGVVVSELCRRRGCTHELGYIRVSQRA